MLAVLTAVILTGVFVCSLGIVTEPARGQCPTHALVVRIDACEAEFTAVDQRLAMEAESHTRP
jgi:hypothetical protein